MHIVLNKEGVEAWNVLRQPIMEQDGCAEIHTLVAALNRATERFLATDGIAPNSYEHGLLMLAQYIPLNTLHLRNPVLSPYLNEDGNLNENGKRVLNAVNKLLQMDNE